jgi:arabinose-5-phosphate isomerase
MTAHDIVNAAKEIIVIEMQGLEGLLEQIDDSFARAVDLIANLKGRVMITGVGKSGIIARKIASTMVSIGTPAFFMHPVDGLHGDLGTIMPTDMALILSNSGNTREIMDLLPSLKSLGIPVVSILGEPKSELARASDIVIKCKVDKEACDLGLAPTASTTAQLALGDALAVVVSRIKGFDHGAFKALHPAGQLGRQLMSEISQVMITGNRVPFVTAGTAFSEVLDVITSKGLGITLVGSPSHMDGIITDGDLRRAMRKYKEKVIATFAKDVMSPAPRMITGDKLVIDALEIMEKYLITTLVVVDSASKFMGVIHLHDLLGRGKLALKNV